MYYLNDVLCYGLLLEARLCYNMQYGSYIYSTLYFTCLQLEENSTIQMEPTNLKPLASTTSSGHLQY